VYGLVDCLEFFETTPSWLDFCISVLDCDCERKLWEILQALVTSCYSILPFEGVCVICDRPNRLSFNAENRLYAKGEPAIEFRDGFGIYVYEGEWIGGVLKAPERQELHEEQPSACINSLPSQLTFLVGDNHSASAIGFIILSHNSMCCTAKPFSRILQSVAVNSCPW
jgi:hypothetical protein